MNRLSPEARDLLEQAAQADEPTAMERKRARAALMAATVGGVAAASTATSAAAATGGGMGWFAGLSGAAKVALVVGTVAFTGVVAPRLVRPTTPSPVRVSVSERPASAHTTQVSPRVARSGATAEALAPVDRPIAVEETPPEVEEPGVRSVRAVPRRMVRAPRHQEQRPVAGLQAPAHTPRATTAGSDGIRGELRLLSSAQRALASGDAATAMRRLAEHARRYPQGQMAAERDAARVLALRALGRASDASAAQALFLAQHPGSPLAARLRR